MTGYERFAGMLREKGIVAYDVSKETGITPSTFTDWKKGRSKPKVDKLIKIAAFLDCPLEALL